MKKIFIFIALCCSVAFAQENKTSKKSANTVSFSKEVMPVFKKKCMSCHNSEDEGPSGLYLDDYGTLMSGESRHGPVVKQKKGEESILIKKLRGTAEFGRQMPRGRKPLDDETIDMISRWIDQGAKKN